MRRLITIQALPPHTIRCEFDTGERAEIDLLRFLEIDEFRGVFAPMRDAGFFGRVVVGPRGRSAEWPGEIDLCADALHRWALGADHAASSRAA
jgi:hypothetical protein